jgi:uncharacterized protein YndB with AHSA1/START domain
MDLKDLDDTLAIEETVRVPALRERAFHAFARELDCWWPPAYTWAGDTLRHITIEPFVGGRCLEIGPSRFVVCWGQVTEWDGPARLAFTWQISMDRQPVPNPEQASLVVVRFAAVENGTQVQLTHRAFERHGDGAEGYRDALARPEGWPHILSCFQSFLVEAS